MTTNDRGTVNMASTGCPFARARECHNWPRIRGKVPARRHALFFGL